MASFHLGIALHIPDLFHFLRHAIENPASNILVGDFPTPETDGELHFVPIAQKLFDVAKLGVDVMLFNGRTEANLFDLNGFLVLPGLFFPLALLIAVFTVIHDPTNRRFSLGRDIDEVQIRLLGQAKSFTERLNTQLVPIGIDQTHLTGTDGLVHQMLFFANNLPPPKE